MLNYLKPSKALSALIRRTLMLDTNTTIRDIIVHSIADDGNDTCELSLEIYKSNAITGEMDIIFKNMKLVYKEDEATNEEIIEENQVISVQEQTSSESGIESETETSVSDTSVTNSGCDDSDTQLSS